LCISYKGAKLVTDKQITLETCGAKGTFQKIQLFDDMTIRFTDSFEYGFNIWGSIGGGNGLNNRMLKTFKVTAANNEAFLIRTPAKLIDCYMVVYLAFRNISVVGDGTKSDLLPIRADKTTS